MTVRLSLAALILLGVYGAVRWVQLHGIPSECASIQTNLQDLPTSLGGWNGKDAPVDPELFRAVGARMLVDRLYHGPRGQAVTVQTAAFDVQQLSSLKILPHQPDVCYTSSGWEITNTKFVSLDEAEASDSAAAILTLGREGQICYVLYWYQIEGDAYCTPYQQRQIMLGWRGRSARPPILKVMLQTTAANADEAEKTLLSLATEIYKWTRAFH
jgi:EpsI family protein